MAKVLEALVARGRRVRRAREQREVAFGLADLSTKPELLEKLVTKGATRSLTTLLERSKDPDATRFSALALANMASAGANRVPMVNDGSLRPLIDFLRSQEADLVGRQYAAAAVGNLLSDFTTHEEAVRLEALPALVELLKHENVQCGRFAAHALSNLAANARYRFEVVQEGAVPPLVAIACSDDPNAQKTALSALRAISISPEHRSVVVKEGVLDPLVLLARSPDTELLREVAAVRAGAVLVSRALRPPARSRVVAPRACPHPLPRPGLRHAVLAGGEQDRDRGPRGVHHHHAGHVRRRGHRAARGVRHRQPGGAGRAAPALPRGAGPAAAGGAGHQPRPGHTRRGHARRRQPGGQPRGARRPGPRGRAAAACGCPGRGPPAVPALRRAGAGQHGRAPGEPGARAGGGRGPAARAPRRRPHAGDGEPAQRRLRHRQPVLGR